MLLPDLKERHVEPEVMDQPGLDAAAHRAALRGLARINSVSNSAGIVWEAVRTSLDLRKLADSSAGAIRILDVACGGGDVAVAVWRRAREAGVPVAITAVDVSETAVEQAQTAARAAGADIDVRRMDVLRDELPAGFDVAVSSLFVHHLSHDEAVVLLRKMATAAKRIIVNDLERARAGYLAAAVGTRVLSGSPVVHVDGPRSVRAALSAAELRMLARDAGLEDARVTRRWPFRLLLEWGRA